MANGRHFVFSCGVGIDATVVKRVDSHPRLKARAGQWYYTWAAVSGFYRHYLRNPVRMRVEVDGERVEGVTAIAQNSDPFTYFASRPVRVCEGVAIDDGTLSLGVLKRAAQRDMPTLIAAPVQRERPRRPRTARSSTSTASPRRTIESISEDAEGGTRARSRSRWTATTSASGPSSSCGSSPGALTVDRLDEQGQGPWRSRRSVSRSRELVQLVAASISLTVAGGDCRRAPAMTVAARPGAVTAADSAAVRRRIVLDARGEHDLQVLNVMVHRGDREVEDVDAGAMGVLACGVDLPHRDRRAGRLGASCASERWSQLLADGDYEAGVAERSTPTPTASSWGRSRVDSRGGGCRAVASGRSVVPRELRASRRATCLLRA